MKYANSTKPLRAERYIRRMRGGSFANVVYCSDGRYWVLKSPHNPQGTRTLVNEMLTTSVFRFLQIDTPKTACIEVTEQFVADNPEFDPAPKTDRAMLAGRHFGSRVEVASDQAIWDLLPDVLIPKLSNPTSFVGGLVVDQWLSNTDHAQAVFVREKHLYGTGEGFTALHIDRGQAFGGARWELSDSHLYGVRGHRPAFFDSVTQQRQIDDWTKQIEQFPETVLYGISRAIPSEWIDDRARYEGLVESILRRRSRAAVRMDDVIHSEANPFRHLQGRSRYATGVH